MHSMQDPCLQQRDGYWALTVGECEACSGQSCKYIIQSTGGSRPFKVAHMSSLQVYDPLSTAYGILRIPQAPLRPSHEPVLLLLQLLVSHGSREEGAVVLTSLHVHACLLGRPLSLLEPIMVPSHISLKALRLRCPATNQSSEMSFMQTIKAHPLIVKSSVRTKCSIADVMRGTQVAAHQHSLANSR